jgi:hypothetical protein
MQKSSLLRLLALASSVVAIPTLEHMRLLHGDIDEITLAEIAEIQKSASAARIKSRDSESPIDGKYAA